MSKPWRYLNLSWLLIQLKTAVVNLFDKVPWLKSVLISGFASEQGVSTWRILIHSAAIAGAGAVSAFAQGKKPGTEETQADVNLKTAIEDALEALRRNKNCKKLLEANGMDPEQVLQTLRRKRQFGIEDMYARGKTVDQVTGGSGQGRGTKAAIIMDRRSLTDDRFATSDLSNIDNPRIRRAVTVLHETGHATGAVPYSRGSHTGTFGGEHINDDPDKINNKIGVTCFPGKVQPK